MRIQDAPPSVHLVLAGGVLLSALTDVIGFAAFLAVATVFIL